ncbi:MAG: pitrilysin family protein [Candidatus Omnitrophota bacterium]
MRIFVFFILLCLLTSTAFALKKVFPPHTEVNSSVSKHTFDNGLTLIAKRVPTVPLAAIRLVIKTGSADEGRFSGSGISHFVEHMLFKGTSNRPVGEIERQIKSYGGYINASTSYDTTEVFLIVRSQYLKEALELLGDLAFNPLFDESEFLKERQVILNEIRMNRDDPANRASLLLWESAYQIHPYRYPVIGYKELFEKLNREDLIEYHSTRYVAGDCVLSVVGDIEPQQVIKTAEDIFGRLPRKVAVPAPLVSEPLQMSTRMVEEEFPGLKISYLLIAFHSVALADGDLYPLDALASAIGDGESSRLYERLVKRKKLAYSVSAYNFTPRQPGLFIISMRLENENIGRAVSEVLDELEKIRRHSLSWAELRKIKRSVVSGYIYGNESIEERAEDYASSCALTGDFDFSKAYIEGINKVNVKDIQRVSSAYLNPSNLTVAVINPEKSAPAKEFKPDVLAEAKKSDIKKIVIPNGAILLTHEDHSYPVVSINVLFKGGVLVENKANNGITRLVSRMLLKGAGFRSSEQISRDVESRGISLTGFSGKNSFGISLKCLKEDIDFSLRLLSDILSNPSFPEREMRILKDIQVAEIKSQDEDVFSVASKELIKSIFKTHPYGMTDLGTIESVNNLQRNDLLDYWRHFVNGGNAIISVFGDIDFGRNQKKISKAFGKLKRGNFTSAKAKGEPPQAAPRRLIKEMPKEQAVLMIGYPGADVKNPDTYVLDILNSILSRQGGRLYMDIREKLGLSYTLGSFSVFGIDPGYNAFYVATSYSSIEEVAKLALRQINMMKREGPTQEEMELAKSDLVGAYFRALEINSELGFKAGLDELYGLGYDNVFKYPEMISAVTGEDVMRAANKYFDDERLNEIMIIPNQPKSAVLSAEEAK